MTLLEQAKSNITTPLMKRIAGNEGVSSIDIRKRLKEGKVVIPKNKKHNLKKPCGIGFGLRTKINANIGTSSDKPDITEELKKLEAAVKYGSDAVMDLSTGGDLKKIRREILKYSPVPV
ncbi:MAG: phosphomethylpyrimidine synthase ThiC, partial [Candidatus Omnitrophota bacterium]